VWFQTSVERDLVYTAIYRAAGARLDAALRDKHWDALPKEERSNDALAPAASDHRRHRRDRARQLAQPPCGRSANATASNEAAWGEWVNQRAAKALPGAKEFLNTAASKGVTVFYISNRDASLAEATLANLRQAGFPVKDDSQFLGLGTVVDELRTERFGKACRRQLVARRYRVLMQFGDQVGDFVQILANTRDGRPRGHRALLAWIGERWCASRTRCIGSWEPALFDNEWRNPKPRAAPPRKPDWMTRAPEARLFATVSDLAQIKSTCYEHNKKYMPKNTRLH
jgi:acid phosphatase